MKSNSITSTMAGPLGSAPVARVSHVSHNVSIFSLSHFSTWEKSQSSAPFRKELLTSSDHSKLNVINRYRKISSLRLLLQYLCPYRDHDQQLLKSLDLIR